MKLMATKIPRVPPAPPAVRPRREDGDSTVLERRPQKIAPPQMYQVVMLNDDYTPMDFVVTVLMEIFHHTPEAAVALMLAVHEEGKAIVGVYPKDIAQTKCLQVLERAMAANYPLLCTTQAV